MIHADAEVRRSLCALLQADGHRTAGVASPGEARSILSERNLALVLFELDGATREQIELLERARVGRPDLLLLALGEGEDAVSSWRTLCRGAFDFVWRPTRASDALRGSVRRALAHRELLSRIFEALAELSATPGVAGEVGAGSHTEREARGADAQALRPLLELARCALRSRPPRVRSDAGASRGEEAVHVEGKESVPPLSLAAYERLALVRALFESQGDATAAARALGIGRSTFYRKAARHGLLPQRAEAGREGSTARSAAARGVGAPGVIG